MDIYIYDCCYKACRNLYEKCPGLYEFQYTCMPKNCDGDLILNFNMAWLDIVVLSFTYINVGRWMQRSAIEIRYMYTCILYSNH